MGTKIKGIYKGFKQFTQIFVVRTKEQEIEIGLPTDVKHVAHIGWDGPSASQPSWMKEFKTAPDYASTSIGNINETRGSTLSTKDLESVDRETTPEAIKQAPCEDLPKAQKKHRRKKNKSDSSPKSSSSSRSSPKAKAKNKLVEESSRPANIVVM